MCKIMVVPHIKEPHRNKAAEFLAAAGEPMCKSDKDGIGFAALSADGDLYGARWADRELFMDYSGPDVKAWQAEYNERLREHQVKLADYKRMLEAAPALIGSVLKLPKPECPAIPDQPQPTFYNFGTPFEDNQLASFILHSRLATCEKGLHNNHPMWHPEDQIAMIHNGQIRNAENFENEISTLDSEAILQAYRSEGVAGDLNNIQAMADKLRGYYACAAYAKNDDNVYVLDFWRDDTAQMDAGYVHELDALVFCTRGGIIEETCKALKWNEPLMYKDVAKEVAVRFDPLSGVVLDKLTFKSGPEYNYGYGGSYNSGYFRNGKYTGYNNQSKKKAA